MTLYDRRPRLIVRSRKGKWVGRFGEVIKGTIEVYNSSARPTSISEFRILGQGRDGLWREMNSELMVHKGASGEENANFTPQIVGPYCGIPIAISTVLEPQQTQPPIRLKVCVQDLFEKWYSVTTEVIQ